MHNGVTRPYLVLASMLAALVSPSMQAAEGPSPAVVGPAITAGQVTRDAHVEFEGRGHVRVLWHSSSPVDVYSSTDPEADVGRARLVTRANTLGSTRVSADPHRRTYFLLRSPNDGEVVRVGERILPLERGSNFRDVGGYPTDEGRHVRWGAIYRAAATPLLSDADLSYIHALGLKTMIDLRSTEERELAPTRLTRIGIRYVAYDYPFKSLLPKSPETESGYREWLTALAPQYRAVFHELLAARGPVVYSCTAGQDRTGEVTALVLAALGVPREVIMTDYLLSTRFRRPEYEVPAFDPAAYPGNSAAPLLSAIAGAPPTPLYYPSGRPLLQDTFDEIDRQYGSIETYLNQVLGVDRAQIASLRREYLD